MANHELSVAFSARSAFIPLLSGKPVLTKNQRMEAEYGKPIAWRVGLNGLPTSVNWSIEGLPFWANVSSDGPVISLITGTPLDSSLGLTPIGTSQVKVRAENQFGFSEEYITIVVSGEQYIFYSAASGVDFFYKPFIDYIVELDVGSYLPDGVSFHGGAFYGLVKSDGLWVLGIKVKRAGELQYMRGVVVFSFSRQSNLRITKKANIDSSNWSVSFEDPGNDTVPYDCGIRYGDIVTFELLFPENYDLTAARFAVKGLDTEPVFLKTNQYSFSKISVFEKNQGYRLKCLLNVKFESESLLSFLSDVETDGGASRLGMGMFEFEINNYGRHVRYATRLFSIKFIRDTIR